MCSVLPALNPFNSVDVLQKTIPSHSSKGDGVTTTCSQAIVNATTEIDLIRLRYSLDFSVTGRGESKESPAYKRRSTSNRLDVHAWYYNHSLTCGNDNWQV